MSKPPPAPPSLAELRKEIDSIDEQVHRLLMAARRHHRPADPGQADPGGRLGVPSGARGRHDAAAGAAPSRHPADRHRREHLARHHLDLHLCAGAVLGACRHLGRRIRDAEFGAVSFRLRPSPTSRISARRPRSRRWRSRRAIWRWSRPTSSRTPWWIALEAEGAPKIIARLPFLERADHPAALPVFVMSRVADRCHGDRGRDVERARFRLERRNRPRAVAAGRNRRGARYRLRRRRAAGVGRGRRQPRKDQVRADRGRRLGALLGPRRQPRNALYGAPERAAAKA